VDAGTHRGRNEAIIRAAPGARVPEEPRPDVFVSGKSVPRLGPGVSIVRAWLMRYGKESSRAGAEGGNAVLHRRLPMPRACSPQRREA
jgi:hypothetical protein